MTSAGISDYGLLCHESASAHTMTFAANDSDEDLMDGLRTWYPRQCSRHPGLAIEAAAIVDVYTNILLSRGFPVASIRFGLGDDASRCGG